MRRPRVSFAHLSRVVSSHPMKKLLLSLIILKAIYTPVPNTDREYAQSAIERNELAHREIARNVWLIEVPEPDDWQTRLNAAVDRKHGSFRVTDASDEEKKKVESGEITLQK